MVSSTVLFSDVYKRQDRRKQEKLRTTAQLYLAEHTTQLQPRFDVVEIYAPPGLAPRVPELYVIPDAF